MSLRAPLKALGKRKLAGFSRFFRARAARKAADLRQARKLEFWLGKLFWLGKQLR
jgi:hypothetical protein